MKRVGGTCSYRVFQARFVSKPSSGEDETKMGSIFVPHFHPPMVGMEVL